MTQEEIIEGRILIENFMELRVDSFPNGLSDSWYVDHKNPDSVYNGMSPNEAKFHSSWDWIIPVVEKIIGLGWQFQLNSYGISNDARFINTYTCIQNTARSTPLLATYNVVIDFIKRYNQNKQP
jgi:hypothetical protein